MKVKIELYITFNTEKRKIQTMGFKKLMSNSVFTKTMESFRNSVDLMLVKICKNYQKIVLKQLFASLEIFIKKCRRSQIRKIFET